MTEQKEENLDALWGFDGEEPEIPAPSTTEKEEEVDSVEEDAEEDATSPVDEDDEDDEEEGEPAPADEPKAKQHSKQVPYDRFAKEVSKRKEMEAKLAEFERKVNGIAAVDSILNKKTPEPELSLDEQLKAAKLNPDKYFDDDEKREALEVRLEQQAIKQQLQQQQHQLALNHTIAQIEQGVSYMQAQDPAVADSVNRAIEVLINNQAFFVKQGNPAVTKDQAKTQAYYNVMNEVANRAVATGQHPANIIAKLGADLAVELGIDISPKKALSKGKEDGKINHKNREESQKRAGRPAIDASQSAGVKIDDDAAALFASF